MSYEITPIDTVYVGKDYKFLEEKNCVGCGTKIYKTITRYNEWTEEVDNEVESDNALFLTLTGGYSQFIDQAFTVILCHECAHDACHRLPWLNTIIGPHRSHAHTMEFHEQNPDHYGWDYDNKP